MRIFRCSWKAPFLVAAMVIAFFGVINHLYAAAEPDSADPRLLLRDIYQHPGAKRPNPQNLYRWSQAHFSAIDSPDTLIKTISSITIAADGWQKNSVQVAELWHSISSFLWGYAQPNYETFKEFCFPIESIKWNESKLNEKRKSLMKVFPERTAEFTSMDFANLFKESFILSLIMEPGAGFGRPRLNPALQTTPLIREVATDMSHIYIEKRMTLSAPIIEYVASLDTADGIYWEGSSATIEPNPEKILQANGEIDYATVRLMLKTRNDSARPYYLRFYWLPEVKKWVPLECSVGSGSHRDRLVF